MGSVTDEKTLGRRLQLARKRAGLTQQELCQKAGLSYSTLAKIERGAIRSPSVFTVVAIAGATDTPMEDLLDIQTAGLKSPAPADTKKRSKTGVRFVYFEVGGVLIRFFHRAFSDIADKSGVQADIIETLFWRHNDEASRGQIGLQQLNDIFKKELGLPDFDWKKHFLEAVESTPGVDDLVRWTTKHYDVGLLSNIMPGFLEELKNTGRVPNADYVAIVDSSKVGAIKPEARIYEVAQELAGVEPSEILLIDANRANLTGADKAGWQVLNFDDMKPGASIARVKQVLEF